MLNSLADSPRHTFAEGIGTTARAGELASLRYHGPERRYREAVHLNWLTSALDEIDYGVILLGDEAKVLHINHAAKTDLDEDHPLQLIGTHLKARVPREMAELNAAIDAASSRGLRKLLSLGAEDGQISVSVVPLRMSRPGGEESASMQHLRHAALVMLGKRKLGGQLLIEAYARSKGLSPAETRVLQGLCRGAQPLEIAAQHGVAIATVRTQIGNIRAKTGASSIRALVRQVSALPPFMGALQRSPWQ